MVIKSWLVVEPYASEKYEFVNWDDDIPNIYGKIKNVPNHQAVDQLVGFHGKNYRKLPYVMRKYMVSGFDFPFFVNPLN